MGGQSHFFVRLVQAHLVVSALLWSAPARAATTIGRPESLLVTVEPSGAYEVTAQSPEWRFGGDVGSPLSGITVEYGSDTLGAYGEVSFDFQRATPLHAAIRTYLDQRIALFTISYPASAPNATAFPSFSRYPQALSHMTFSGTFAFPTFSGFGSDSPWVFFNSSAQAFVISPASNFMVAQTAWGPGGEIASGISPQIASLPQGFSHRTLLVVDDGVNRAYETWGKALTTLHGKTRPASDADASLAYLGYWTDAGSTYYYNTEPSISYPETLEAVKAGFDRAGIGLGYLQLDSWFYSKGASADWTDRDDGISEYVSAPALFGSGLEEFRREVGVPLITHARWIDTSSPYRQMYRMSGDVSIDPRYWDAVAGYLADSGVVTYEQDWLSSRAQTAFNLTDPDAFLDNMANAMRQRKLSMQYCMASPRHFLQGAKYDNLTSVRASADRFGQNRWTGFLYASRLASALGIWPFADVFLSTETANLLLATLSAGPVGVGDRIGALDAGNLLRAARPDGAIVKPDAPLTPLDSTYLSDASSLDAPVIASTYSDFGGARTYYLFAYDRGANREASYKLSEIGLDRPAYLYDLMAGSGRLVEPEESLTETIAGGWLYRVVAPVGRSGIALLGDTGHFVSMGKKRVTRFSDDGIVRLTIAFAPAETSRTIRGYSPDPPTARATTGSAGGAKYDAATHEFQVAVSPGPDGTASLLIARHRARIPEASPRPDGPIERRLPFRP